MADTVIYLEDIYHLGRRAPIFDGLSFRLHAGERVALVGSNGAGKSSLLHLMIGLYRPAAGRIVAFGCECRNESEFQAVRARMGLVFQDPDDQLFCPTVLDDVAFGPLNLGSSPAVARDQALNTLEELGLVALADCVTHHLSGGEKRLVALATVLAMDPSVLLLDEPTNALDETAQIRLTEYLEKMSVTMVIATHDDRLIDRLATRAVVLRDGALIEGEIHRHPHVHHHTHVHIRSNEPGDHHVAYLGSELIREKNGG
jgi:cobalt/nickel transport system ATP-binding protein